jgi:VIT1/CCC1 family predicted Fe2+/Mn2+ transporter
MPAPEEHRSSRAGWLRASVLGANDGILSTASLLIGVAAAGSSRSAVLLAGAAGLAAGALSMAAGEYVSVSSQADAESADLVKERRELDGNPEGELEELAGIYEERGLNPALARQVAQELMDHDALGAHATDELGFSEASRARPLQAALASAAAFTVGALLPLLTAALATDAVRAWLVAAMSLIFLALLGATGAWAGGAPMGRAAVRVSVWGAGAMAITAAIGSLFEVAV